MERRVGDDAWSHAARARLARSLPENCSRLRARWFPCYDHPLLPRTNNDMEQSLRARSSRERRITRRKHIGPKRVRTGGLLGAAKLLVDTPDACERLALLPDAERRGFQTRRTRQAKPRGQALAFRCKPVKFLSKVELLT